MSKFYLFNSKPYEEPNFSDSLLKGLPHSDLINADSDTLAYFYQTKESTIEVYLNGQQFFPTSADTFFIRSWRHKQVSTAVLSIFLSGINIDHIDKESFYKHEIYNSKICQPILLSKSAARFPNTWIGTWTSFSDLGEKIIQSLGQKVVVKSAGGMGQNVNLFSIKEAFQYMQKNQKDKSSRHRLFQIQEYIENEYDLRIMVLNDNIIGTIKRSGEGFLNNISQGGNALVIEETREEKELAISATRECGLDLGGVDFIRTVDGPRLLEVNRAPGIESISAQTKMDFAQKIGEILSAEKLGPPN